MKIYNPSQSLASVQEFRLKKLTEEQVEQIDQLLDLLGEQGEVHLIVQRGILKYINKVESQKPWNVNGAE